MKTWIAAAAVAVIAAGCASKSDVDALKKEVEALKATQAQLVKRVGGVNPPQQQAAQPKPLPASIDLTGAPFKGSKTSPVVLAEFSDYECPFCVRHFTQVMPEIERAYVATNKIRYTFRDFPIDELHPESIRAHVAAHCAIEQGQQQFWNLHNRLFTKPGTHKPADLQARAQEAGLNAGAFNACVADDKYSATIRQSTAFAISLGASGTPFFVIGTMEDATHMKPLKTIPGAFPFTQFQQAIDAALAQK